MRRINILFIIGSLGFGGAERQIVELVKGLDKTKYNPLLCIFWPRFDYLRKEAEESGVKVIEVEKRGKFDISIIPKLIRVMKKERIDIVHTFLVTANTWGRIAAKLAKVPIIISSERDCRPKERALIRKILNTFTDKIIVNAYDAKKLLIEIKAAKPNKIKVIWNGVDLKRFDGRFDVERKKKEFDLEPDAPIVGMIARFHYQKNHKCFLEAAKMILETFPKARFLLIGDGELKKEMEEFAFKLNLHKNVIFTGEREGDIPELLSIFDVSCLSSRWEGMPNVLLESMAAGKPVVATSVSDNPKIVIDGKTGFLVPPDDPFLFSQAVIKILGNKTLAEEMGQNGKEFVRKYLTIEKMVKNTEMVYEELIKRKILEKR